MELVSVMDEKEEKGKEERWEKWRGFLSEDS